MDHAARLERLRGSLDTPFLVSTLANLRYLTGFEGSNGHLLLDGEKAVFVTDGRYGEVAARLVERLPGCDLEVYQGSLWPVLGKLADGLTRLTLEANGVTWSFVRHLAEVVSAELSPAEGTVERLRMSKDPDEIEALRKAAAAGDHAFAKLPELAGGHLSEADLAWALQEEMRHAGAAPGDWEPIVAVGANAAMPHYRAGEERVGQGLLLLDYGCAVDGYHSDMSRTVWLSTEPDPQWEAVHGAVLEAQLAAIATVRPGVSAKEVDRAAREVLEGHGHGEHFVHSTGHGVGLDIHEDPKVGATSDDVLQLGNVITVEPGVYLTGRGGVRIEDMVVVTEEGRQVLTGSPKELQ